MFRAGFTFRSAMLLVTVLLFVGGCSSKAVEKQNAQKLHYRSVFDINLTEEGTYKVEIANQSLMAFWKDADGKLSLIHI